VKNYHTVRILFTACAFIVLGFVGCNKPPKACIEMDQTTVGVGVPVTFTSCSKRALSYEWFMDGPPPAPENSQGWSDPQIIHSFSVAGTYTITLNVYSKFGFAGDKATATATLVVQ